MKMQMVHIGLVLGLVFFTIGCSEDEHVTQLKPIPATEEALELFHATIADTFSDISPETLRSVTDDSLRWVLTYGPYADLMQYKTALRHAHQEELQPDEQERMLKVFGQLYQHQLYSTVWFYGEIQQDFDLLLEYLLTRMYTAQETIQQNGGRIIIR